MQRSNAGKGFEMESDDGTNCLFLENPCERVIFRETGNWRHEYGDMPMLALVAEQDKESIRLLQKTCEANEVTLYGAMSLVEIGTTGKDQYPLFHNATIVALRYAP